MHVVRGPEENLHRPAIDPLFRTAARAYGRRVVGVILSGTLDDGTAGLLTIKRRGGIAVVQDPDDAMFGEMPRSAIENVEVDYVLPLADIPALLVRLAQEPIPEETKPVSHAVEYESEIDELDPKALEDSARPGHPSKYSCPACGGVLWELQDGHLIRFRCRVGHAYSAETLLNDQANGLETALWAALKTLEERIDLTRHMAKRAREQGRDVSAEQFERQAREAEDRSELIRRALLNGKESDE